MRRPPETETVQLPATQMAFVDNRIAAIVHRACHDANIVESATRSCYLQGLWDGVQLALKNPELVEHLRGSHD